MPLARALARFAGTAALVAAVPSFAFAQTVESVVADKTEFVVKLSDGRTLRSADLVGAELSIDDAGRPLEIRIDAVEKDPKSAALLHVVSMRSTSGEWAPFCEPDADGRRAAFPVAGRSRADGRLVADPARFELVCTSGAQGKCVRLGYAPWQRLDAYNACVHMIRADYCGDGVATTRDGTTIDIYDSLGVQQSEPGDAFVFEAGWSPDGAVCVHHPRIPENTSLEKLAASCPRLVGHVGAACTESAARAGGALVFNRSVVTTLTPR
ncbi:MAG: ADYC domain-containing protein [bacterium]